MFYFFTVSSSMSLFSTAGGQNDQNRWQEQNDTGDILLQNFIFLIIL